MKKISLIIFSVLVLSTSIYSQKTDQPTFGLGWYSTSAPIGGRLLFNNVGIDLGLGYASKDLLGTDDDRFHVNVGVVFYPVKKGNVSFFIRPGLELQTGARKVGTETKSKMIITADLGAEWFVTDQFSLSVGHGLQFEQLSSTTGDDKWGISALRALSFNNVGFHFYFN